jgi:predicted chitinase
MVKYAHNYGFYRTIEFEPWHWEYKPWLYRFGGVENPNTTSRLINSEGGWVNDNWQKLYVKYSEESNPTGPKFLPNNHKTWMGYNSDVTILNIENNPLPFISESTNEILSFADLVRETKKIEPVEPKPETTVDSTPNSTTSSDNKNLVQDSHTKEWVDIDTGGYNDSAKNTINSNILLTKEQMVKIGFNSKVIDQFFTPLNEAMKKYNINTPLRIAHFLAQVSHESGFFKLTEELATGDAYEGRKDLGNTQTGDGKRFKGRGLIQITGRGNYSKYGKYTLQDFVNNNNWLKLANDPKYAIDSACWYWEKHWSGKSLSLLADNDDVVKLTKRVNGGTNGLADRVKKLKKIKTVLGIV